MPVTLSYRSFKECMEKPDFSVDPAGFGGVFDFDKFGRPELLHLCFAALDDYRKEHQTLMPVQDAGAADKFVKVCAFVHVNKREGLRVGERVCVHVCVKDSLVC